MSIANQQTRAQSGAKSTPQILEKGSYVPWASRFFRFFDNKREEGELMGHSIDNDIKVMNCILQGIPNDIYNYVDACKDAQTMWNMIKRLMQAKKAARNHDPLALVANSHAHYSHSHASPSYSRSPQLYYVTHPISVIDYDDDYQGEIQRDAQEDKLSTEMIKNVGYAGNGNKNEGRTNRNQATNAGNGLCYNCNGKCYYARDYPKIRVCDAKYFREQMLLAAKDEAGVHLDEEENDFMLMNAYDDDQLEELNALVIMMACIQPTDDKSDAELTYDVEVMSEETLEDTEESRLKMKDKIIPLDYSKLNKLYESFVTQTEISAEQTYLSPPSTSNVSPESCSKKSDLPPKKMPNESQLLKLFVNLDNEIKELGKLINIHHKIDKDKSFIYDNKDNIRRIFTLEVVLISRSLNQCSKEIKQEITVEILENDSKRSQAQSIDFELKLQHQKEKNAYDISWKSKMAKLNDENVSLNIQVESLLKERENIKFEYQKLFNSIKTTRVQNLWEVNELIENVNQNTYAYADVRFKNQDLLMTISELKDRLKTAEKGNNVNTKFDKFTNLRKLLCVTPMNKDKELKAKMVSKVEVKTKKSKPVTSRFTPKNEQAKTVNAMNDGLNLACVSCGKDVFMISHDKCVARYALSANSKVKRALFTSLVAAKSSQVRATPVLVLWIVDSGYSKHMTGNLKLLRNFVEKFIGTFRFGNDHFIAITGYGYYVQGNLMICHVYYVEGLGHNLFSVEQFCDGDLELAFRSNTCYVRNLEGEDLLIDSRESNLYTISISEIAASSPVCLMSKATSTKSWFLALGLHLEDLHVTWAYLEKKRTRLRLYTKNHEELCIKCVETASGSL
ncbi:hypothetical protein Tco_1523844 [Tanacetum coccineum]